MEVKHWKCLKYRSPTFYVGRTAKGFLRALQGTSTFLLSMGRLYLTSNWTESLNFPRDLVSPPQIMRDRGLLYSTFNRSLHQFRPIQCTETCWASEISVSVPTFSFVPILYVIWQLRSQPCAAPLNTPVNTMKTTYTAFPLRTLCSFENANSEVAEASPTARAADADV
jgi:hypothetical protein